MKRLRSMGSRLALPVVVSFLLAACGDDGESGSPPAAVRFEQVACEISIPQGQDPGNVRCGFVTVPEDRSKPNGRAVKLAVAVLKATGANPASDPVVYLGGGPGGAVLDEDLPAWTAAFAAPLQAKRDIVFFDLRGTGRSDPLLACPEWQQVYADNFSRPMTLEEDAARLVDAMRTCHTRLLSTGVNLAAYKSTDIVADMHDILTALGYREWNLYGLSYGGRVALTAMRDTPTGIRSVVLDSPVAVQANQAADGPANLQRHLNTLFSVCSNDSGCNAKFPHLDQTLFTLVEKLNASPAVLRPLDADGKPFTVVINGDLALLGIGSAVQNDFLIPYVPALIATTARGNYALATQAAGQLALPSPNAFGMEYSVRCNEDIPFNTPEVIEAAEQDVPELFKGPVAAFGTNRDFEICRVWGSPTPAALENAPVVSPLPTMIFGGEFDEIEPYGRLAAQTLSHSFSFLFPGQGHVEIYGHYEATAPSCGIRMMAEFLADPTRAPDASCIAELPPLHFLGT